MTAEYFQIVLNTRYGCDGRGLKALLERVLQVFPAAFVALSDVDLAGEARRMLAIEARGVRTLAIGDFLALLDKSDQVVWATIFLCRSREQAASLSSMEDYTDSLKKVEALVRVVDAGSYYIYGPAERLSLLHQMVGGDTSLRSLDELEFPE